MELQQNQFSVLTLIEKYKKITQRELSEKSNLSLGTINMIMNQLEKMSYIEQKQITEKGIAALEPYKVKRALILAAGFGSRLVPITLNTPKPLVRIKGIRIIDTLLDAITSAGIEEIIIVRGYLSEQFDQLLYKYPNIKFIENPMYSEANNISSASVVKSMLQNAYVFEADLFLSNPELITKYQYSTNYLGIPVDSSDDWCFETKHKYISKLVLGGKNCYQMVGISFWSQADGKKMELHIQQVYDAPGGKERYWDQVALEYYLREYKIQVRSCTFDDVIEIDSYSELKKIDPAYEQTKN